MEFRPISEEKQLLEALSKGVAVTAFLLPENLFGEDSDHTIGYYQMFDIAPDANIFQKRVTILSEIANMGGHYVVVSSMGKIVSGLHIDIFYVEDEE